MPPTRCLDLSAEQLAYLQRVVTNDVGEACVLSRSSGFSQLARSHREDVHHNICVGSILLGLLSQFGPPVSQPTLQE